MTSGITQSAKFQLDPSSVNTAALDVAGHGTISASTSGTVSLTTVAANDIIVVGVSVSSNTTVSTIADTRSLTWNKLAGASNSTSVRGEVWWAYEPTAQTHTITVTLSASGSGVIIASAMSGLNTAMPIDPQSVIAVYNTGTAVTTTSTNVNPCVVQMGFVACLAAPSLTVGSGYTTCDSTSLSTTVSGGMEYQKFSASAPNTVNYTLGTSQAYVLIGFALMSAGTNYKTVQPSSGVEFVVHDVIGSTQFAICMTDGANIVLIDTSGGPKWDSNTVLHVTNTQYMLIINISTTVPGMFGYDGMETL